MSYVMIVISKTFRKDSVLNEVKLKNGKWKKHLLKLLSLPFQIKKNTPIDTTGVRVKLIKTYY